MYVDSYSINFNEEKNELLKATRQIDFDDVINSIEGGKTLGNLKHFNSSYKNQYVLLVVINNYVYVVPYVRNAKKKEIFLKTIYPSRKLTKLYRSTNEKQK